MDSNMENDAEMEEDTTLEDDDEEEEEEEEDDDEEELEGDEDNADEKLDKKESTENGAGGVKDDVYLPGKPMEEGEELTFDKSAYTMYHSATTGSPCLSFDIIPDDDSQIQTEFPFNCDIVCGTQSHGKPNLLLLMKMMNLTKMEENDSDSEDSYIEEEDKRPQLFTLSLKHTGDVNRIRYTKLNNKRIAATWSSIGNVEIWDLTTPFDTLNNNRVRNRHQSLPDTIKPLFSFSGHQVEGYAMDWSQTVPGRLATGSCNKNIHIWQPNEGGTWHVDQRPLNAHTDSVEDIQWSPNERNVFASCSVDKTVRIWDANLVGAKANMMTVKDAHDADVNVISWNGNDPFIVSGGDDGVIKVWDLRQLKNNTPVATFKHHSAPITSVEWHPTDSSVFAASGSDNQITIWDLAVERDDTENVDPNLKDIPPQLLFIHMGQTDIKEVHWHKKMPGVIISTAASGFNVFRTISV